MLGTRRLQHKCEPLQKDLKVYNAYLAAVQGCFKNDNVENSQDAPNAVLFVFSLTQKTACELGRLKALQCSGLPWR